GVLHLRRADEKPIDAERGGGLAEDSAVGGFCVESGSRGMSTNTKLQARIAKSGNIIMSEPIDPVAQSFPRVRRFRSFRDRKYFRVEGTGVAESRFPTHSIVEHGHSVAEAAQD